MRWPDDAERPLSPVGIARPPRAALCSSRPGVSGYLITVSFTALDIIYRLM